MAAMGAEVEYEDDSGVEESGEEDSGDGEEELDGEDDEDEVEDDSRDAAKFNANGLLGSLATLRARGKGSGNGRYALVCTSFCEPVVDADDDLKRELAIHDQALDTARRILQSIRARGERVTRPTDFYAEMVKSDSHMRRVRGRILLEQQRRTFADERRKLSQQKKYAKELEAERLREKARAKKDMEKEVRDWRNKRKASGYANDDGATLPVSVGDIPLEGKYGTKGREGSARQSTSDDNENYENIDDVEPGLGTRAQRIASAMRGKGADGRSSRHVGDTRGGSSGSVSKKRYLKDKKFGSGGQKKLQKQNDAYSSADMADFRAGHRKGFVSKKGNKSGAAAKRPGKRRRAEIARSRS